MKTKMFPPSKPESQAGITLMLSILVLAGITAIAFSLAAIVFVEIRSSGDLLRTEPALYAVQSVTEEAFYSTTRGIDDFPFSSTVNGVTMTIEERQFDSSPKTYVVYNNAETKFSLANPAAPFQNAYISLEIEYISPQVGTVVSGQVVQYEDEGEVAVVDQQDLAFNGSSWVIDFADYPNNEESEFEILLTTDNANNATVLVTSVRKGTPDSGLPLVGREVYDVTASYLGLTRKYTVSTPTRNDPVGGGGGGGADDDGDEDEDDQK